MIEERDSYYEARYSPDPSRTLVWKEIVRHLGQYICPDDTVVDLGAGYCDFINNITCWRRIAVDLSPLVFKYAESGVEALQTGAWDLKPIADSSVQAVFASNLFEHFDDDELAHVMAEVKRVLAPSGKLILMQPNYRLAYKNYFNDYTHKKVFSDISLEGFLVAHNFRIYLARPRFLPFSMKSSPGLIHKYAPSLLQLIVRAYINSPIKPFAGQMLFVAEHRE